MGQYIFFVVLGVIFTSIQGAKSSDVRIEIQPKETVALLDETVSISCDVDSHVQDIVLISISKDGKDPIAVIRQNSINVTHNGQDVLRYQASGCIDKMAVQKYLTLNVTHPKKEDNGTYICKLIYLDHFYTLKQVRASGTLSVKSRLEMDEMEIMLYSLQKKVFALESENHNLLEKMTNLTEKVTYTLAFSATVPSDMQLTQGQVVVFHRVLMNEGNGYNRNTGVFTAPRKGLYAFNLGYMMNQGKGYSNISIQKNWEELARGHVETDRYTHTSCSTVVTLEKGDRVMCVVKQVAGPALFGRYMYSVFNGYLIKTL